MRQRRETVEHPFGTIKARMGATHFLMKTLPRVASEMALHVLAYNLTRVMNIMGIRPLMAAMTRNVSPPIPSRLPGNMAATAIARSPGCWSRRASSSTTSGSSGSGDARG